MNENLMHTSRCSICDQNRRLAFRHLILDKYSSSYFYCDACGLMQTEYPYWLEEAYNSAISDADTGLVYRNIHLSKVLSSLLFFLFDRRGKYLDVAGGYGLLTRLMRDIGFDFYWSDKYCENLLARGFDGKNDQSAFAAVTAFEVLEHVYDPLGFISAILSKTQTKTIIFSTELFASKPPRPEAWWYYAFKTGQHISFYQKRTLQAIADKLGLFFYSSGGIHMMSDKKVNRVAFSLLTFSRTLIISSWATGKLMTSRRMKDHFSFMERSE